jgi:chemotaxis protein CheD
MISGTFSLPFTCGDPPLRRTVAMGALLVSATAGEELITYALGSCLGIMVHDPTAGVGGLLHVMLPESSIDPEKAQRAPAMFVDTGVPLLFRECYRLGAAKQRMTVKVAGGASRIGANEDSFQIGKRNELMLRKLLWKNGVLIHAHDVGGNESRTVSLRVGDGTVLVKSAGRTTEQNATCVRPRSRACASRMSKNRCPSIAS